MKQVSVGQVRLHGQPGFPSAPSVCSDTMRVVSAPSFPEPGAGGLGAPSGLGTCSGRRGRGWGVGEQVPRLEGFERLWPAGSGVRWPRAGGLSWTLASGQICSRWVFRTWAFHREVCDCLWVGGGGQPPRLPGGGEERRSPAGRVTRGSAARRVRPPRKWI